MFQVYKDYNGYAPDANYWLVTTEAEANRIVAFMERLREKHEDGCFAHVDGWEHAARWRHRPFQTDEPYESFEEWLLNIRDMLADLEDEEFQGFAEGL